MLLNHLLTKAIEIFEYEVTIFGSFKCEHHERMFS